MTKETEALEIALPILSQAADENMDGAVAALMAAEHALSRPTGQGGEVGEAVRKDYARYDDIENAARDAVDRIGGVLDGYSLSARVRSTLERARDDLFKMICKEAGCGISTALSTLRAGQATTADALLREALPKLQAHAVDTPHNDERQATLALIGRIDAHLTNQGGEDAD